MTQGVDVKSPREAKRVRTRARLTEAALPHLKYGLWFSAADFWCERGDLNPHELPRQILSLVRLPIPPLSRFCLLIVLRV